MKKFLIFTSLMVSIGIKGTIAQSNQTLGSGADVKKVIAISKILAQPEKYLNQEVTVKGEVEDVCKMGRCWMNLASDKKAQSLRIKVKDGEIMFPLTARGKIAIAKGFLSVSQLTKEQAIGYLKHLAEEQGHSFDPLSVKGPMMVYQVNATGALILK